MSAIQRKLLAHYINAMALNATTAIYERLGQDLEEYNIDLKPDVETKANILGESTTRLKSYEPSSEVKPYYADPDTSLYARLQDIIDNRRTLDDVKADAVEVHLWELVSGTSYVAYREDIVIEVTSYGGGTDGYEIPFTIHYTGNRIKGVFDVSTKTFTADTGTLGTLEIEIAGGSTAGTTKVTDVIGEGTNTLMYKVGAKSMANPAYNDETTGYTALTKDTDISVTAGQYIVVVAVSSTKIVAASAKKLVVVT